MPALSERASRAHRARRLQSSHELMREQRIALSASPSRYNSRTCSDPDSNNKRASSIPPTSSAHRSEMGNRTKFMDIDMDEDMPMDEFQQVVKSRVTQFPSIHPPQLVSPVNDISVSSVSSSEEPQGNRSMDSPSLSPPSPHKQPTVVTPPRNLVGRTTGRYDTVPRNVFNTTDAAAVAKSDAEPRSADSSNGNTATTNDPIPSPRRHAAPQSMTSGGATAQPRPIAQSRSFDSPASTGMLPRQIGQSSTFDAADTPPRHSRNFTNTEKVDYARRQLDDSVSNKKIYEPSVDRLTKAIRTRSNRRPDNLSPDEKALWDVVQNTLSGQRSEMMARRRILERQLQEATAEVDKLRVQNLAVKQELDTTVTHLQNTKRQLLEVQALQAKQKGVSSNDQIAALETHIADLQHRYDKSVEVTESCQEEHERAICAIQRVLADVNDQKEEQLHALHARIKELQDEMDQQLDESPRGQNTDASDVAALRARAQRAFKLENEMEELKSDLARTEEERDELQQHLDKKTGIIVVLEQELSVIKNALQNAKEKEAGFEEVIARQRKELAEQVNNHISGPEATRSDEVHSLQKQLDEKAKSLDNAKALITSLEIANNATATSLRSKLKGKDEQLLILKADAADRERRMDSIATELRDLQNLKSGSIISGGKMQENLSSLSQNLTTSIVDLQSAAVVLESSGGSEGEVIDEITAILCSAITSIKSSLANVLNEENIDLGVSRQSRPTSRSETPPPREMADKLKKMDAKLKVTDAALKKAEGDVALLKVQNERLRLSKDHEESKLMDEIDHLRNDLKFNQETLEKKAQELQVLRDSLEVGDEVGYISGDESDEDDDGHHTGTSTGKAASQDALAALLARGGVDMAGTINAAELDKMKNELKKVERERQRAKESLKSERESLANAKMIISSLERANKTMLEDLRSRLQDSNTAISALLDKSMITEKAFKDLKLKFQELAEEKDQADMDHEAEVAKLKSEALITALRLAAKEREVDVFAGNSEHNPTHASAKTDESSAVEGSSGE